MTKQQPKVGNVGGVSAGPLKSFVERAERLLEIRAENAADLKDLYAEVRANGYDATQVKRVIAYRKADPAALEEADTIFHLYLAALGHLPAFEADGTENALAQAHVLKAAE